MKKNTPFHPIKEIIKETEKKGSKTVSQTEMQNFWDKVSSLTKEPLDVIREKRITALSSDTKLVLG